MLFIIVSICQILGFLSMCIGSMMAYGFLLNKIGFIFGFLAVILAPVTIVIVPWYEGFSLHEWMPVILIYSGLITASVTNALRIRME